MPNTNEPVGNKSGLSTLQRARFGPGMLLQHEDLDLLNTYTRDLSRLLFKSFFGCGVVCGLTVKVEPHCDGLKVTVDPGVALSCAGDPLYVPKSVDVQTKEGFVLANASHLWVELCGTVKCCAPRHTSCSCDDDETTSDCTREKDGFEIRLREERPPCLCGCAEPTANPIPLPTPPTTPPPPDAQTDCRCVGPDQLCYEAHYAGKCGCECGECSSCDCECILLARLYKTNDPIPRWRVDHRVRRFIRPVLMRDPQPERDRAALSSAANVSDETVLEAYTMAQTGSLNLMDRSRKSLELYSPKEQALVGNILKLYPVEERPRRLFELVAKYVDVKTDAKVPVTRQLTLELKKAKNDQATQLKTGGTK